MKAQSAFNFKGKAKKIVQTGHFFSFVAQKLGFILRKIVLVVVKYSLK